MTPAATPGPQLAPARRTARKLARHLRGERPDYACLKEVFRYLREELGVEVTRTPKKLPYGRRTSLSANESSLAALLSPP